MTAANRKKLLTYIPMYAFYILFFVYLGTSSFQSRYLSEIGMTDSQIGLISSIPAIAGLAAQPIWGTLSDRVQYKRTILIIGSGLAGLSMFITGFLSDFLPVLIGMTLITVSLIAITPTANSIALEHNPTMLGPLRMTGTIGYQIGAVALGFILTTSLRGLLQIMGLIVFLCSLIAWFQPPIKGHQYGREKVSYISVFKDKKILFLLITLLICTTTTQYYNTFFVKMLGDLGFSNATTGIITFISIFFEIPFLYFSHKLYRKATLWTWLLIGMAINAVRFTCLGFAETLPLILLINIPTVSVMGCFEFFPALYLNDAVDEKLKGSAQSALNLSFAGGAKLLGSLLGGFLGDTYGLQTGFICCGCILAITFLVLFIPCRRLAKREPRAAK